MPNDDENPPVGSQAQPGDPPAQDPATQGAAPEAAGVPPAADAPGAGGEQALTALRAELEEAKDRVLRAYAESENVRRRAARDVENAHRFALEKFTADLLPVVDSLEHAVDAAATAGDTQAVAEGVELALKLFLAALEKAGIRRVDPLGAPFDPGQQEAMAMVENPNAEPNTVMEVMQKGYLLNGRLVRAARVIVAKAPAGSGESAPS